jgi:hypothetical protein
MYDTQPGGVGYPLCERGTLRDTLRNDVLNDLSTVVAECFCRHELH